MRSVRIASRAYGLQIGVLALLLLVLLITTPAFRGASGVFASFEGLTLLGIAAAGVAVTMIAGELDLSVGSMAALSGVIAVQLGSIGLVPSLLIATGIGVAAGLLQGYAIARLGINSMVFTVGSLIVLSGAAWLVAGGQPIALKSFRSSDVLLQRIGVLTVASAIAVVIIVAIGIFLARTSKGREIYAVGGSRQEAIAAGVPLRRSLVLAFTISGGCAALAGALASVKSASAAPDNFGTLLLSAVGACLIGGISLSGGRGNFLNLTLGVFIMAVLAAGMSANAAPAFITQLLTGFLLLLVISTEFFLLRRRKNRSRPTRLM